MSQRIVAKNRKTTETDIRLSLNLDGKGDYQIATGSRFLITCLPSSRVTAVWILR